MQDVTDTANFGFVQQFNNTCFTSLKYLKTKSKRREFQKHAIDFKISKNNLKVNSLPLNRLRVPFANRFDHKSLLSIAKAIKHIAESEIIGKRKFDYEIGNRAFPSTIQNFLWKKLKSIKQKNILLVNDTKTKFCSKMKLHFIF